MAEDEKLNVKWGNEMGNNEHQNVPRCPTCQSTKVEKISTKSKVGKAVLWGVFAAGSINKIFKCNNCGYKW